MTQIHYIPETAPFTPEQRAWLNGFLAGLLASDQNGQVQAPIPGDPAPAPAAPLTILFGSQTGTAEGFARFAAKEAAKRGFSPRVLALNDFEQADLARCGKVVIISSTWGDGDPPDNAISFWSWLNSDAAPRLEALQFAVLGLGDRNYADFCGASRKFDTRLEALGARRLAPRGECDVDYESTANSWLNGLWDKLQVPSIANGAPSSNGHVEIASDENGYSKKRPFPAPVLRNVLLNKAGSNKEVHHYELSLDGSGLTYEVGDSLGVLPVNCPGLVDELIAALHCKGDEPFPTNGTSLALRDALATYYDLTRPSQDLLAAAGKAARGSDLNALLHPERASDLKTWLYGRDVLDILKLLPSPLPLPELAPLLRKLAPRLYSISSSPKAHPGEVHLTVSAVRYECHGRKRKGVASTFLADRIGHSDCAKVYVQSSHGFKPPTGKDVPMIMIGPGTGIAPFRAFLEERQALGVTGRNWLFFGDQKRHTDFLYEEQLTRWLKGGHLARLDLAFSRDETRKVYVQNRMLENRDQLWSWLEDGAHVYVCGDAARMARDVDATLHRIVELAGGKSSDEARAYVAKLHSDKRYQRDVY